MLVITIIKALYERYNDQIGAARRTRTHLIPSTAPWFEARTVTAAFWPAPQDSNPDLHPLRYSEVEALADRSG